MFFFFFKSNYKPSRILIIYLFIISQTTWNLMNIYTCIVYSVSGTSINTKTCDCWNEAPTQAITTYAAHTDVNPNSARVFIPLDHHNAKLFMCTFRPASVSLFIPLDHHSASQPLCLLYYSLPNRQTATLPRWWPEPFPELDSWLGLLTSFQQAVPPDEYSRV